MDPLKFARRLGAALKFSSKSPWELLSQRLHAEPSLRWGTHPESEEVRPIMADAYQDHTGDEEGAELLRNPKQHVILGSDGSIKKGRLSQRKLNDHLLSFYSTMDHYLPFGYPNRWQAVEAPDHPGMHTLQDFNYNEEYPHVHGPEHLGPYAADYLDRDVDLAHRNGELDDIQAGAARSHLQALRTAPYEEPVPEKK